MDLKYTYANGRKATEFMLHDGIEARYVLHPDGSSGWYDRQGLALVQPSVADDGQENDGSPEESGQSDERVQSRNTQKRQTRTRQGSKGQKP